MNKKLFYSSLILIICILFFSCTVSDTFQQQKSVQEGKWYIKDAKKFVVEIDDSNQNNRYDFNLLIRNDDAYSFENIWIKIKMKMLHDTTMTDSALVNCQLSNNDGEWLGKSQGSLFDHRIRINAAMMKKIGTKQGTYEFTIVQMMRHNPLQGIHNVGMQLIRKTDISAKRKNNSEK